MKRPHLSKKLKVPIAFIVVLGAVLAALILGFVSTNPADDNAVHHGYVGDHAAGNRHGIKNGSLGGHRDQHGHGEHIDDNATVGPHGGKMLANGHFRMEVLLVGRGGEARFRIYLFNEDEILAPKASTVTVRLTRPDGTLQPIPFTAYQDHLMSTSAIAQPYAFEVAVSVQSVSEPFQFSFGEQDGLPHPAKPASTQNIPHHQERSRH